MSRGERLRPVDGNRWGAGGGVRGRLRGPALERKPTRVGSARHSPARNLLAPRRKNENNENSENSENDLVSLTYYDG